MKKKLTGVALVLAAVSLMGIQPAEACTRAVYLGPDGMVVTGRTMDWKEDIMSNIYVFPRGMQRAGHNKEKTVNWTSKYGSVIATGYDIGTCDGMNEKRAGGKPAFPAGICLFTSRRYPSGNGNQYLDSICT